MAVTIQTIIADKLPPTCVALDAMATDALQEMIAGDFSQLPIINSQLEYSGMITADSITRALHHSGLTIDKLRVSNALRNAKAYRVDGEFSDLLDGLRETYAAAIVDRFNVVKGIVTNYDVSEYFRSRSEDMILVEDVETALKECIRRSLIAEQGELDDTELMVSSGVRPEGEDLREMLGQTIAKAVEILGGAPSGTQNGKLQRLITEACQSDGTKTFDDLTLNEYITLFFQNERWGKFEEEIDLPKDACKRMFEDVRKVRNDLFHFRTDISADRRSAVQYCRDWLERNQQTIMDALSGGQIAQPAAVTIEALTEEASNDGQSIREQVAEILQSEPQLIENESLETSKYAGIATFLQTLPQHVDNIELSFDEFVLIIEGDLPRTAYEHRSWWANDSVGHVQSQQWLEVGWRVSSVNLSQQRATFARIKDREQKYIEFFSKLLIKIREKGVELKDVSPSGRSFIQLNDVRFLDTNERIAFVGCSFARKGRFRVEYYIDAGNEHENSEIFKGLQEDQDEIQREIGWNLDWETLDDKRAMRIAAYHPGAITDDKEGLIGLNEWAAEMTARFVKVFIHTYLVRIN